MKKWATGIIYPPLKRSLAAHGWHVEQSLKTVINNPLFVQCAQTSPVDPFSISSYSGIVYGDFDIVQNMSSFSKAYPGILFINAAIAPYWLDKYKMNALFDLNDSLKQYKADWKIFPKKYDSILSQQIQQEMPSELYVIKPRKEARANGVIVVTHDDLDTVLKLILEPETSLAKHPDKKYSYWLKNQDDTFLIEKYYKSDYVWFSPPLSEKEYLYDATLRIACIMQYNEGKLTYHSLGGFWKLPPKALTQEGTLNETRISLSESPFYMAIDPALLNEVNSHLERAMLLLYQIMLDGNHLENKHKNAAYFN